ncbi:hypothetical protein DFP81_11647 [Marinomonas pollencensis]|uniref:Uncharacterized protein n=1 Tax=Marinomonas pollencensis TaxID=491954 RepID=A0A3E0DF25_9GAMM|nr:hypothetical protein DFP81_11647 [Marinomonas pollencensis]
MPIFRRKINHPSLSSSELAINLDAVCVEAQRKSLELNRYDERFYSYDRFSLQMHVLSCSTPTYANALGHLDHNQSD